MLISNDGGSEITFDTGKNWSRIDNMPTGQFYRLITDNLFPYNIYGGQQDNSSIKISRILFSETKITIVPGITSIQVLLSEHKITLNNIGKSVQITTGRNLKSFGFQKYENRTIVLLDGECSFKYLKDKNYFIDVKVPKTN